MPKANGTIGSWAIALWSFSRPHTIIGTTLSVVGLWVMALSFGHFKYETVGVSGEGDLWSISLILVAAWFTCIAGNVYIVGLNQLTDVEIDRINKPHLPLASGDFSQTMGLLLVGLTGAIALSFSLFQGPFLMATVWASLLIGTVYSLPPIRLKRFPFWASVCIFTVRGVIVNLGLFLHFSDRLSAPIVDAPIMGAPIVNISVVNALASNEAIVDILGLSWQIPIAVWLLTAFVLVFTFAIAIFKDIPDIEGDRKYHITTFTVKLGAKAVFNVARWVITVCYLGTIVGAWLLSPLNAVAFLLFHGAVLTIFWILSWRVDLGDQKAIAQFYQFIWKLFFLEYLAFPVLTWAS
ncbi:MAG: homogentisate phytyltransferase [Merismopedia sp. SIO2A8]|nr:homogentisate phytyltransferase [Merismopedia sp. SIO2A8]